ncbi:hypothetical protein TNCV_3629051 [Trichonephila clavipes]|nr:hypothetical protein TNCV_3629051 [Trichonephila clavipes]
MTLLKPRKHNMSHLPQNLRNVTNWLIRISTTGTKGIRVRYPTAHNTPRAFSSEVDVSNYTREFSFQKHTTVVTRFHEAVSRLAAIVVAVQTV